MNATPSRNCCSVSQPKSRTTPGSRNGIVANPLPKANVPALAKNTSQWTWDELRKGECEPIGVVVEPLAALHQVTVHVAEQGDGPPKPVAAIHTKIPGESE